MKQFVNFLLIILIIVVLIFALIWVMMGGDMSKVMKGSASVSPLFGGSATPTADIPPEARYPGTEEVNASSSSGEVGRQAGDKLFVSHGQSVDVEEKDRETVWANNAGSIIWVSRDEFDIYVLEPGSNLLNTRLLEVVSIEDNQFVNVTSYQGDEDTSKGYAAKFKVVLPHQGRYYIYDEMRSGMNDRFAWLVQY